MLYFRFIFRKLFLSFILIQFSLMFGYFCLELAGFNSFPSKIRLFLHFWSLFLSKSDFFFPFSFLLSSTHTLQSLKQHGELIALQTGGLSRNLLSRPFYTLALLLTLFSYWNTEFGSPLAASWKIRSSHRKKSIHTEPFEVRLLPDQSRIFYQKEDSRIFDLYWITKEKEIFHCKEIIFENDRLVGHFVDKLIINQLGRFEKGESFINYLLPFSLNDGKEQFIPPEKCSLSSLYSILTEKSLTISTDRAKFLTSLIYKLIYPWFPFLVMTILLIYVFPKRLNSYIAFSAGIFCFLLFYSMMKTFIILGENYFISPWFTLCLVPLGLQGAFTYKLCRKVY